MLKNFLILVSLSLTYLTYSQESIKQFPKDYLGRYTGELKYETSKGIAKIPMEFILRETDSVNRFDYWLIYNNQPRKYTLITKNSEKGIFEIDENNGIVLPARFFEDTLYSWFEVGKNKVSSRLAFDDRKLYFEILFSNLQNKTKTGGISDQIPNVFGFPISTVQRATLIKQD